MGAKKKEEPKPKTASVAVACWILAVLVLFMLFIIKQNDIRAVLKETEFFTKVFGKEPDFVAKFESSPQKDISEMLQVVPEAKESIAPAVTDTNVVREPVNPVTEIAKSQVASAAGVPPPNADKPVVTSLWFIEVDADGSIARREVQRTLPKTDSPLTTAIQDLLKGPSISELDKRYMNLIPEGTKLRSVLIIDGVATLDFSEEFEYNKYGVEGYRGQLEQIVYTATAFPTVDKVLFLIDGELRQFIGGEGIRIDLPLSRESFR
jgi:spore germination protein GerM